MKPFSAANNIFVLIFRETKKELSLRSTIADGLQHVHSAFVHLAASLQILFIESKGAEQSAVILQDLYVVRHMAVHLKVLLGL